MIQIKRTEEDMIWTEIDSIVIEACLDSISMLEMKAYKYMTHIDSLSEGGKMDIQSNAQLCASRYGRGVHLMRAIASAYDTTDYRVYDMDCETAIENRLIKAKSTINKNINIHPNPNDGNFVISIDSDVQLKSISIFDYSGQLMQYFNNPKSKTNVKIINISTGLYFVQVLYENGQVEIEKFIINN